NHTGISEAPVDEYSKCSKSESANKLEPTELDILRAELYVTKFESEVKESEWNLTLNRLKVVLQNNTNLTLQNPFTDKISRYSEMPQQITAGMRGQFAFRKPSFSQRIMFSYRLVWHNLVVGVRTNSKDEFVVGFDCYHKLNLNDSSLNSDLYKKLLSEFWGEQDENDDKTGLVVTRKFRTGFLPIITVQASMTAGVLKIQIFEPEVRLS
ncbi:unnamed protein product, partial [Allacma fusca]